MPNTTLVLLIALLPLAAFILLGLWGKKLFSQSAGVIATVLILAATMLAWYTAYKYFFVYGNTAGIYQKIPLFSYSWLSFSPGMSIDMGIVLDPISAMMLVVVPFISLMVHVYSLAYLKGEERGAVYYAYLGLFTFAMLGLVLSANIFQLYFFWELVGVSSFLLIGFYYQKPSAVAAAKKAFIVTRFADLGFLIGILVLSSSANSFDFATIIQQLGNPQQAAAQSATAASFMGISALSWGVALVFMGGAGKSAMLPLHIWLPDAMEGPTPVSALIHAATMVVAGVFLVARLFLVFSMSPAVLQLVAYTGAGSAVFAAIIACTQTDIKRVLAYSTMSQIGFMMFALGISGKEGDAALGYTASMFHLFTHAMFKALLFLAAGSIIHFVHSNHMSNMGNLRKYMPVTHGVFLIACLAIAGIPPFAGFFSKEAILLAAFEQNKIIFYTALFTSGLTAFYMFRLYFKIFWGTTQSDYHSHGEGGAAMLLPLLLLGVASCAAGFIPFGNYVTLNGAVLPLHLHIGFSVAPVLLALAGIAVAAWLYKKANSRPAKLAAFMGSFYKWAAHKFYVDELYNYVTQKIIFNLIAKPAAWIDKNVVDGLVNFSGNSTVLASEKIKGWQSGKVQQYATYFLVGIVVLAVVFIYLRK
ncbi:MAG: NADH-quinone oxidoreductase subunit [Bacteroidota bacterium]|jgi:NADH-quinone oxidoreductase subunit L